MSALNPTAPQNPDRGCYPDLLAWLRGPRNGLGDIYRVDIGALRLAR
jgi:hypothetical protein